MTRPGDSLFPVEEGGVMVRFPATYDRQLSARLVLRMRSLLLLYLL